MKRYVFLVLLFPLYGISQMNYQIGQSLTVGNAQLEQEIIHDNYSGTYYSDFRKLGTETFLKVSNYTPDDDLQFSIKYTLALGLKHFNFFGTSIHKLAADMEDNSPTYVGASSYAIRTISATNGADFIYSINDKFTLINTLALKVAVINRVREMKLWGSGRKFNENYLPDNKKPFLNPIISVVFAPQLLINYNRFSLGLHLNQDVLILNNVVNSYNKIQLSPFTSFGISFMPNFQLTN